MLSVSELTTWVQYVLMVIASFLEGDVTTLKKKKKVTELLHIAALHKQKNEFVIIHFLLHVNCDFNHTYIHIFWFKHSSQLLQEERTEWIRSFSITSIAVDRLSKPAGVEATHFVHKHLFLHSPRLLRTLSLSRLELLQESLPKLYTSFFLTMA